MGGKKKLIKELNESDKKEVDKIKNSIKKIEKFNLDEIFSEIDRIIDYTWKLEKKYDKEIVFEIDKIIEELNCILIRKQEFEKEILLDNKNFFNQIDLKVIELINELNNLIKLERKYNYNIDKIEKLHGKISNIFDSIESDIKNKFRWIKTNDIKNLFKFILQKENFNWKYTPNNSISLLNTYISRRKKILEKYNMTK